MLSEALVGANLKETSAGNDCLRECQKYFTLRYRYIPTTSKIDTTAIP